MLDNLIGAPPLDPAPGLCQKHYETSLNGWMFFSIKTLDVCFPDFFAVALCHTEGVFIIQPGSPAAHP